MGIWIMDWSNIQMIESSMLAEWFIIQAMIWKNGQLSIIWIVIWVADKTFDIWSVNLQFARHLNNGPLK